MHDKNWIYFLQASFTNCITIGGPTGSGKSTVVNLLMKNIKNFFINVSYTTRGIRIFEKKKSNYGFVNLSYFNFLRKQRYFLEWALVYGSGYASVRNYSITLHTKKELLFDVDIQGAMTIKRVNPSLLSFFILPYSLSSIIKRLIFRKCDSYEGIKKRLEFIQREMRLGTILYDYVLVNEKIINALSSVYKILLIFRK